MYFFNAWQAAEELSVITNLRSPCPFLALSGVKSTLREYLSSVYRDCQQIVTYLELAA